MNISKEDLEKYQIIGEGNQGHIYRYNESTVIKLLDDGAFNYELLKTMSELSLQQFIKPIEEVEENGECYAFAYPFLDKTDNKSILLLLKKILLENIQTLLNDIKMLSEKRILIRDIIPLNSFCIDDRIYMFDFDRYVFANERLTKKQIYKLNLEKLEQYFHKIWIKAFIEYGIDRTTLKYHQEYFEKSYIQTIKKKMKSDENIKEYIKRKMDITEIKCT